MQPASTPDLKQRWRNEPPLLGLFARLTDPSALETLGLTPVDVVMIDAEHGSFDRACLSQCVLAARSVGLPTLVRVPDDSLPAIQHAVGIGADGIVVPHVAAPQRLAEVVHFARTTAIERAHAGATRISRLRRDRWEAFQRRQSERLLVIAQIDEPPGLAAAQEVVAVPGLDGIFMGRIGLALAMGAESAAAVDQALAEVCRLGRERGLLLGLSLNDEAQARAWQDEGVGLFVIDSDHTILLKGTEHRLSAYRALLGPASPPATAST